MDRVQFFRDCDSVLHKLATTDYSLFYDELREISPDYANYIIHEFEERGIAHSDFMKVLNADRVKAKYYLDIRFYERKIDEALADKKRDDLSERSTISAEESAKWAHKSADAATRSAVSSERAWIISIVALIISAIGVIIEFLCKCS